MNNWHVLVVEDDPDGREVVAVMLRHQARIAIHVALWLLPCRLLLRNLCPAILATTWLVFFYLLT